VTTSPSDDTTSPESVFGLVEIVADHVRSVAVVFRGSQPDEADSVTVAAQSDHVGSVGVLVVVVETARSLQVVSAEPVFDEVDQSAQVGSTGSVE
jgi:hypothetical protein